MGAAGCAAARAQQALTVTPGLSAARRSEARPETWRVRFSLRLPSAPSPRRRAHTGRRCAASEPRPLDLARRCEALRRVLDDPAPAIARLARRLYALAERAPAVARRIALQRPRALRRAPLLFAHACVRAYDAFAGSS
jgi:hypothetical protein